MENVVVSAPSHVSRHLGRSVGAVLAGFITIAVSHTGTDAVLHRLGVFPPAGQVMSDALFGLALGYRTLLSVLGAYVTVRLAPARPLRHALVLGAIGVVLSLIGLLATLGRGPELGPRWYPLCLALSSLPCCWLAARLAARRPTRAAAQPVNE